MNNNDYDWFERLIQKACVYIWRLSEWSGIGLGRAGPHVFGYMIGAKSWHRTITTARRI